MKKDNTRALIIGRICEATNKGRRAVNGTRISYVMPIMITAKFPNGMRLKDAVTATGLKADNLHHRFKKMIAAGFLRKSGCYYFVSDKGQLVYQKLCDEFERATKEITNSLLISLRDSY